MTVAELKGQAIIRCGTQNRLLQDAAFQLGLGQALNLTCAFIKEDNSMSTRFDQLPPKPEYIAAVKAAPKRGDESSIRDISRETGLSQTQSLSALDYLITLGEIEVRRQNQTPTAVYRSSIQTSGHPRWTGSRRLFGGSWPGLRPSSSRGRPSALLCHNCFPKW